MFIPLCPSIFTVPSASISTIALPAPEFTADIVNVLLLLSLDVILKLVVSDESKLNVPVVSIVIPPDPTSIFKMLFTSISN